MGTSTNIYTKSEDQTGSDFITKIHSTTSELVAAGCLLVDTGTAWGVVGADNALPVSVSGVATAANQATEITSLQLLDDVVGTSGAAAPSKLYVVGGTYVLAEAALDSGDSRALRLDAEGSVFVAGAKLTDIETNTDSGAIVGNGVAATAQRVTIANDSTGTVVVTDGGGSITVDGSVSVSGVVAGTSATSIGKAEDAVAADGDTGVFVLSVRKDVAATTVGAAGDYAPFITDADGKLWVNTGTVTVAAHEVTIAAAQTLATVTTVGTVTTVSTVTTCTTVGTVTTLSGGGIAHGDADSGNPHKIGAKAITAWPTAEAAADRVNAVADKFGRILVAGVPRDLRLNQQTTITSSTAETTIVTAGAANVFHDLYGLIIANSSATDTDVTIKDATAGTTRAVISVKAGGTAGFMLPASDGHKQASAANNWTATCADSVAAINITALYCAMKDA